MKSLLILTLILSAGYAVADDYNGDPNMDVGLNNGVTEGDFSDPTRAHQASLQSYGKASSATCPNCGHPAALSLAVEPPTNLYLEKGAVVSEAGPAVESSGGTPQDSESSQ
ncbi:MAG: hypothetical protein ACK5Y2_06805 [Bdellovibrionales bacterium]